MPDNKPDSWSDEKTEYYFYNMQYDVPTYNTLKFVVLKLNNNILIQNTG